MNTVTDYYAATASQRGDMLARIGHGRRRAAASPFDEIARVGSDGQPYWSARDLANLFGYSDWRNFADCIRKAREQVASHVSAGQSGSGSVNGFESADRIITNNLGKPRSIPDVHLTRFAAYFVALNADQSKPEVRAAVNYYFVGRTIQAEQMIQAGADDNALTAANAKRIADLELAVQGLPEVIGDAIAKALGSTTATTTTEPVKVGGAPRKRGKVGRPGLPSLTSLELASQGSSGKFSARLTRDGFLERRTVRYRSDGAAIREYREGSHVGMFRFRKRLSGPYTASGRYVYVTEAGQRFLAEEYGWEMP